MHREVKSQFRERSSLMDPLEEDSALSKTGFAGWVNLFSVCLFFFNLATLYREYVNKGVIAGVDSMYHLMTSRPDLFWVWLTLFLATFGAVVIQKLVISGWRHGAALFTTFQLGYICLVLWLMVVSDFAVVPSSFLMIEGYIFMCKIHSYRMHNAVLQRALEAKGESGAIEATSKRDVRSTSPRDARSRSPRLRQRNVASADETPSKANGVVATSSTASQGVVSASAPAYPHNVTFSNWLYFLCVPTLVYEIEYPSRKNIRWLHVLEKVAVFFGLFLTLHLLTDVYIYPVLEASPSLDFVDAAFRITLPMITFNIIVFYMIFDLILNVMGELTLFADRRFYDDFWNCVNYDDWARRWNRPTHVFLYRHMYLHARDQWKLSPAKAQFVTFLVSALLHEAFILGFLRKFRPMLSLFQMLQPLLIWAGRRYLRSERIGNVFFWSSVVFSFPIWAVFYSKIYFADRLTAAT
eukprot:TRINITY_DN26751_c0_g1_i1.p1 TRINITY_DN26751_c0_g1~~TRINITY_DN26751_c0_g1_i1.p1  ORF type:complete len:467 (-),score=156.60 TRINITY_DN26751_c0_g1_i1:434-1834(-)